MLRLVVVETSQHPSPFPVSAAAPICPTHGQRNSCGHSVRGLALVISILPFAAVCWLPTDPSRVRQQYRTLKSSIVKIYIYIDLVESPLPWQVVGRGNKSLLCDPEHESRLRSRHERKEVRSYYILNNVLYDCLHARCSSFPKEPENSLFSLGSDSLASYRLGSRRTENKLEQKIVLPALILLPMTPPKRVPFWEGPAPEGGTPRTSRESSRSTGWVHTSPDGHGMRPSSRGAPP